jgi:hypothetical protein
MYPRSQHLLCEYSMCQPSCCLLPFRTIVAVAVAFQHQEMSNPPHSLHVGIIGGGIGGLACAIALRRSGARVTVLEAARTLGEIGAGIQMAPNVSKFLIRWGIDKIIGDNLIQCTKINFRDRSGKMIGHSDLGKIVRDYGFRECFMAIDNIRVLTIYLSMVGRPKGPSLLRSPGRCKESRCRDPCRFPSSQIGARKQSCPSYDLERRAVHL